MTSDDVYLRVFMYSYLITFKENVASYKEKKSRQPDALHGAYPAEPLYDVVVAGK